MRCEQSTKLRRKPAIVFEAVRPGIEGFRRLPLGDIRRQDMPFVSNRMDFTRLQAKAMWFLPPLPGVQLEIGAARTLTGRNVGDATQLSVGFTTAFRP